MRRTPLLAVTMTLALLLSPAPHGFADDSESDHFEKHIRPLLISKCVECHSGRTPDGNLDLSTKSGFDQGGMNGALLEGKEIDRSKLYDRLISTDSEKRMPPDEPLSADELAAVRKWIESGAVWADDEDSIMPPTETSTASEHWAFQPVQRPALPDVKDADWCWTDVDRFVLAKLESAGS